MTGENSDYREGRNIAFKRDDYTCQLCGTVGYPKTEHGLAAVPIEPDDYHAENLVTVCHSCLKKDDQQLHTELVQAVERRQRRVNDLGSPPRKQETQEKTTDLQPTESSRFRSILDSVSNRVESFLGSKRRSDRPSRYELVDKVGERDNFNCQVCGAVTLPRGRVGYMMYPQDSTDNDPDLANYATVCWDCFEWEDDRVIERKVRQSIRLRTAPGKLSSLYLRAILREFKERARLFAHTGRLVVIRRFIAAVVTSTTLLILGALLAGTVGVLLVSPSSGLEWTEAALTLCQRAGRIVLSLPWIGLTTLGIGYLVHVFEQERAYERELFRDQRRRGDTPEISYARPRWQFVAGFAIVGLFGALDWVLVRHDVFPSGMLFGALVLWLVGAAGVAYYLRYALREDRDVDGQPVNPAPWVFAARYALFVALAGGVATLLGTGAIFSPIMLDLAAITAPLVGLFYVLRRYAERRTSWGACLMQHVRTGIDCVWPWDDQWPPEPQHRQQTTATDSTSQQRNHNDSYE